MNTAPQLKNTHPPVVRYKTMASLVAATALFACNCPAASGSGASGAISPAQSSAPRNVTTPLPAAASLAHGVEIKSSATRKAEIRASYKEEKIPENGLGIMAGACIIAACGIFIRQMRQTREGAVGAWVLSGINDALAYFSASILGFKEAATLQEGFRATIGSGGGIWFGATVGAIAASWTAWRCCPRKSLDLVERLAFGASVCGWAALALNSSNVVLSAILSQGVSNAGALLFMRYQYRNPHTVPIVGQALFIAGSTLNAWAMTGFENKDVVLVAGSYLSSSLCALGLVAGYTRVWLEKNSQKKEGQPLR